MDDPRRRPDAPPLPALSGPPAHPPAPAYGAGAALLRVGAGLGTTIAAGVVLFFVCQLLLAGPMAAAGLGTDVGGGATLADLAAQALALSVGGLLGMWVVTGPMEKRSLGAAGLGGRGALPGTAGGFALGAALMSAVIGVLALAGWYRVLGPGSGTGAQFAAYVVLFFLVGLYEEVIFRGILFRVLEGWLGTYGAVGISALLFGLVHGANPGSSPAAVLSIALEAGILLAAVYRLTGNLWWAVGLHWAWNLFQGPVFGVPVSGIALPTPLRAALTGPELWTGGRFGPENGLVALLFATGLGLYLLWLTARRGQVVPPVWKRENHRGAEGAEEGREGSRV